MSLPLRLSAAIFLLSACAVGAYVVPHRGFGRAFRSASSSSSELASTVDGREITGSVMPMSDFVLVKVDKIAEETEGGIILSKSAKKKATAGEVTAVGPGRTHQDTGIQIPMPFTVGEKVQFGEFDGTEINIDGDAYTLLRDNDVLVKYTGELTIDSVQVTGDAMLILPVTEEETAGGLLIAATAKKANKPSTGTVAKIGPGKMVGTGDILPMDIEEGDMVKYRDFAGTTIKIEDEEYSVVKYTDCLAKF